MRAVSSITVSAMIAILSMANGPAPAAADDPAHRQESDEDQEGQSEARQESVLAAQSDPADQMRTFNTDRPTKANVPYTVDAGHFQYETDLVNFTHQVSGGTHIDTIMVPNPDLQSRCDQQRRLGSERAFRRRSHLRFWTPSSTLWGVGDTFVRAKINLWGNDGGDTAAALIPFVKAAFCTDRHRQRRGGRRIDRPARD